MHMPPLHVWLLDVQFVEFVHVPPLQVWMVLPEHCTEPVEHDPVQAPLTQVEFMQAVVVPQSPVLGSHCCTPLPLHCVCPGAHTPVHSPPRHVWFMQPTAVFQVPFAEHDCVELPTHWLVPGAHATQLLFRQAGVAPEHVVWVCQVPDALHDWMLLPRHSVCPGAQTPVQAPLMHV